MKTVTNQETIVGQVQSVRNDDYLIKFAIKAIREGEVVWFNATTTAWNAWSLKEGDEVSLTGKLTSSVWQDPFEHEDVVTLEMSATSLKRLVA